MEMDLSRVFDALPAMAWTALPNGQTDFVNQRWCDYTGLVADDARGWEWQTAVHPDDLSGLVERWRSILASGAPGAMEARVRRVDGQYRRFVVKASPLRGNRGRIIGWCGIGTDVEEIRQAQEALRRHELDLQLVVDSIPLPVAVTSPSGEVERLNQTTLDYFGTTPEELKAWKAPLPVHPDDREDTIGAQLDAQQKGSSYSLESRYRRADGTYRWHNVVGLPLRDLQGGILRWLHLHIDIDEKKRAEEALAASERNLKLIVDTILALTWSARPDGSAEFLSQKYLDYVGLSAEQAQGWGWTAAVHPDDVSGLAATWQTILASGEMGEAEARLRRRDGEYRWFLFRANPLRNAEGAIVQWYGINTDIEELKRAQEALRESERQSRLIVDSIPGMVAVLGEDGEFKLVNPQVLEFFGRTLEELKHWERGDLVHPEDLPRAAHNLSRLLVSGEPFEIEIRARRFDGCYRWLQSRGLPFKDADGRTVGWYNLLTDVDDRKRAEEALRMSEREARLIVESIPAGVEVLTPTGKIEAVNSHLAAYLGTTPEELLDREQGLIDFIHPDDVQTVLNTAANSLATGQPYRADQRFRMADGSYRWFQVRGLPLRDGDGNILRWYALHIDINEAKHAEEALRESERHSRLIVDTIPGLVAVFGPDGEVAGLNRQFLAYLGQTQEEFANWATNGTVHPEDLVRYVETLKRSLASGLRIDFETRLRRYDGIYRWVHVRGDAARDGAGNIVRWYCLIVDVDERKRAEEALAASERNLQLTIDTIPALAWSARPDGTAEFLSKHYLDYAGFTAEQAQGWGWTDSLHPDDLGALTAIWRTIMASGKPGEAEARLRRHDGEYRWFLFRVEPLRNDQNEIVKWYGVNTDIEDRKRSEESFRAIVETSPECVTVIARDGTVLRTNAAGAAMAGVASPDDVVGQNFFDFLTPEYRGQYREFHERVCAGEKGFLEFDVIGRQGVRRHMETHAAPMRSRDGSIVQLGVTRDITERKQAEARLRRSEAFLADAQRLSRTGSFAWRVDEEGPTWSDETYRIYELDPSIPLTWDLIRTRVHPDDLANLQEVMTKIRREGGDFDYESRLLMPDQSIKILHVVGHSHRDKDGILEVRGAVQDITERRRADEALNKARSELAHVARVSSLGALTASIAHEVNQPLAAIVTNASTCLRMLDVNPPDIAIAQETARATMRDGLRAADVIARLRELFSKKPLSVEPLDLNEAAREVIALSSDDLQRARVVLLTDLAGGLALVGGDRIQLQQVIMNLLRNAIDAMRDVEDRPRRLVLRTEPGEENSVRLSVQDNGVGLGPEATARLFEAFYTTKIDGMGIGLSVSRSIVENHGGRLWYEANEGPGVTFSFSIPEYAGTGCLARTPCTARAAARG